MSERTAYYLDQGNALDLHGNTLGQLGDSNGAPGRLSDKELLIGGIHLDEVGHIGKENLANKHATQ